MPTKDKYGKFKKAFGRRVKKAMEGKSPESLATEMNVSIQAVHAWKYGNRVPHLMQFRKLCKALGVSPEQLLYKEKK